MACKSSKSFLTEEGGKIQRVRYVSTKGSQFSSLTYLSRRGEDSRVSRVRAGLSAIIRVRDPRAVSGHVEAQDLSRASLKSPDRGPEAPGSRCTSRR